MKLPQFTAEAALDLPQGKYQANPVFGTSGGAEVVPTLAKQCTNCETVGAFGRKMGVASKHLRFLLRTRED